MMKKLLVSVFTLFTFSGWSQIEALFDIKKFHSLENNYIETYLFVFGNTLFESLDSNFKDKGIEVLQYIEDENKKIIAHKKYTIKEEADYVEKDGIVDLQRFPVKSGKFILFIEITDINKPSNIEKYQQEFIP